MSNFLYLDANALQYAWEAGGAALLDNYMDYARSRGFTTVVTVVVYDEIFDGPLQNELPQWFSTRGVQTIATSEYLKLQAYNDALTAGRDVSFYNPVNAGDRSIAESAGERLRAGNGVAVFSDDRFFVNRQLLQPYGLAPELNVTNADLLRGARNVGIFPGDVFSNYAGSFRENANPYNPNGGSRSSRLDAFDRPVIGSGDTLLDRADLSRALSAGEVETRSALGFLLDRVPSNVVILGGYTFAITLLDAARTQAQAAQLDAAGVTLGVEEAWSQFAARLFLGSVGFEEGFAAGLPIGPWTALGGGLALGGAYALGGEAAVHGVFEAARGLRSWIDSQPDAPPSTFDAEGWLQGVRDDYGLTTEQSATLLDALTYDWILARQTEPTVTIDDVWQRSVSAVAANRAVESPELILGAQGESLGLARTADGTLGVAVYDAFGNTVATVESTGDNGELVATQFNTTSDGDWFSRATVIDTDGSVVTTSTTLPDGTTVARTRAPGSDADRLAAMAHEATGEQAAPHWLAAIRLQ